MEKQTEVKIFWAVGVVMIFAGFIYFFALKPGPSNPPYKVLTPGSYPTGTKVSLYKSLPPSFPADIILEGKPLSYSGAVTTSDGKTQTTVSYLSDKTLTDELALYKKSLTGSGWAVSVGSVSLNVGVLSATKTGQSLLLTIATVKGKGVMLTFQYEK